VVSGTDRAFGYESFARVRQTDGTVIGGAAIVRASRALGIEYAIDRQLHVQAVKTFADAEQNGFLFINFFPGFIQRPEVYLEGLSEAAKLHGIVSKNIVLDFTHCETPHDVQHLKRVTEHCRTRGYAIALDDVTTLPLAKILLEEVRPDYVKLDRALAGGVDTSSHDRNTVRQIVEHCRQFGAAVIAEGVETAVAYEALKVLGVDLFQGYLFSPPVAAETLLRPQPQRKAQS
jgi:EAL domain-containing protein (putative c-di-GMP-specific phosphodiesterase class I)